MGSRCKCPSPQGRRWRARPPSGRAGRAIPRRRPARGRCARGGRGPDRVVPAAFRHDERNGRAHTALTFASRFLLASTTWTPHAIQGSKEWMVLRISIGLVGSATGVFRRASSYGPRRPWASLGLAFHVLGTTHWRSEEHKS